MVGTNSKVKNAGGVLLALLIVSFWIICVYWKCGIFYETNDDRLIGEILSGVVTGKPDGHTVYVNYLLSGPLSLLYAAFPRVTWYGLFLIAAQGAAWFVMLWQAFKHTGTKTGTVLVAAAFSVLLLCNLRLLGNIQYTSTAALLAIAGYVCLLSEKDDKKSLLLFAIFELFAFLLRSQAMLMIQAIGAPAYIGFVLGKNVSWKERARKGLLFAMAVIGVIVVGETADGIAYRSPEWKEYREFNQARTELFDYYGRPGYEEVKEILDRYGVSETEYTAFTQYIILDYDVSAECARELSQYAKEKYGHQGSMKEILHQIYDSRFHQDWQGINHVSDVIWLFMAAWILLGKRWRLALPAAGIGIGGMLVRYYLYWGGRVPFRVMFPVFTAEILLLLALFLRDYGKAERSLLKTMLPAVLCLLLFGKGYEAGKEQYRYVSAENAGHRVYINGLYELEDYCSQRPENRYLIGQMTYCYYRGSALDTRIYQPRNSVLTGTWYSNSPSSRSYLREYFSNPNGGIYLIIYDSETQLDTAAVPYLAEKTGSEPVEVDHFALSHGGSYKVYFFEE